MNTSTKEETVGSARYTGIDSRDSTYDRVDKSVTRIPAGGRNASEATPKRRTEIEDMYAT
uniref:Uncharacterized protein n=1 Tax=Hyaloperonospora arabidopsidis (strain Emoy2) TaxID=559515 RepID=M4BPH9_HYAAE